MEVNVSTLLQLEHNCRNSESYAELKYIIVNETRKLVSYEQAVFLAPNLNGKLKVESISDISAIDSNSSYVQCIENIVNKTIKSKEINEPYLLDFSSDIDDYEKELLKEYCPSNILLIPLRIEKEDIELEYYLLVYKKEFWSEKEQSILSHISSSFSYFLYASRKCSFKSKLQKLKFSSKYIKYLVIVIFLLMFLPVKMTVLAPLEVVAKDPFIVTSSLEGAIDEIKVKPNEFIKKDSLIVKLNDTDYLNKYQIAKKTLNVAKAQLHTAEQGSFYDPKQKNRIEQLKAEVQLKESELKFTKEQLDKTLIYAEKDGFSIIHNPNEWKGKPVVTGERILMIADKSNIELKIMLPVTDAIFLEDNAEIKAFLDNDPLNSWNGNITHITYKPELTPQGILSYNISANLLNSEDKNTTPTIGLRGTAKIYSKKVSLFFYLFKKPITTMRQWIGW